MARLAGSVGGERLRVRARTNLRCGEFSSVQRGSKCVEHRDVRRLGPVGESRVGRVIVAGSRDAIAARTLGFVPSHSIASALEMAHGVAGGKARVGILLAPPYAPLLVG